MEHGLRAELERISNEMLPWLTRRALALRKYRAQDPESVVMVAVTKAINTYDPARGRRFDTWVVYVLDREMHRDARDSRFTKTRSPEAEWEMEPESLEARAGVEALREDDTAAELRQAVAGVLRDPSLSAREIEVLRRRFWDGESQRAIGEALGMTQIQVSRMERRALRKVRAAWESLPN